MKKEIESLVRRLFEAENAGDATTAATLLAADFIPITRGTGRPDGNREQTLKKIGEPRPNFRRDVENAKIDVSLFLDDQVAIAATDLPTVDTNPVQGTHGHATFRNTQVFLRRNDRWQCVAWQVTKVQQPR